MSVKDILESLGAPSGSVLWGMAYGDDMKRAWNECEHPELLLPIAVGVGVPNFDVINACVEVVRVNLACMAAHEATERGLRIVERFICDEADGGEVVVVLQTMARLSHETQDIAQQASFGAVAHTGEAALLGGRGIIEPMMNRLSVAVILSAQARAETIANGSTDVHKGAIVDATLKGTAPLVRRYIPYESFVGGIISAIATAHVRGEVYDEEFPDA